MIKFKIILFYCQRDQKSKANSKLKIFNFEFDRFLKDKNKIMM